MKLVLISDTHNAEIDIPDGNVLIHAGDLTGNGSVREIGRAIRWLESLPHQHKIVIAGNHDFFCEKNNRLTHQWMEESGIHYLHDSGCELYGVRFWGSPYQPWFCDWAFNEQRGEDIKRHWDLIPEDTDVLITHGPPAKILDRTLRSGENVGCQDLWNRILEVNPKIHVFGHIHEAYGHEKFHGIDFYNASIMDINYQPTNVPFVVDI